MKIRRLFSYRRIWRATFSLGPNHVSVRSRLNTVASSRTNFGQPRYLYIIEVRHLMESKPPSFMRFAVLESESSNFVQIHIKQSLAPNLVNINDGMDSRVTVRAVNL